MIVRMKRLHLLLPTKTVSEDLIELQNLGLVDVSPTGSLDSDNEVVKKHEVIQSALSNISKKNQEFVLDVPDTNQSYDVYETAKRINEIARSIEDFKKDLDILEANYELSKRFGGISVHDVKYLASKGITMNAYKSPAVFKSLVCAKSNIDESAQEGCTHTFCLWSNKEESYWVVLSFEGGASELPNEWAPIQFPNDTLHSLEQEISDRTTSIKTLEAELHGFAYAYQTLLIAQTDISNEIARLSLMHNAYSSDGVTVVHGYAPDDVVSKIYSFATADKHWGIVIDNVAADDDNVPTEIRTTRPVRIIKPLFDFLDVDAGYKEFDISFVFLAFMSLFTGMIIGDAGYGFVLFACSLWAIISTKMKSKEVTLAHMLFLWFSCMTMIWGAITGNWFGYKPFAEMPFFSMFIIPKFSILSEDSSVAIQLFAFRVGIVHLVLAHIWRCIRLLRTEGLLSALNQVAQATMLIGLFFLVLQLLLGSTRYPMPSYTVSLIGVGFILVVFTSEQQRGQSVLLGMGKGMANLITLALDSISAFADIISYIRLYAVGLASFSIAASFNAMGGGMMEGGSLGAIIGGILIIVFGHTLNIIMSVLAVVVHGVRLNVLEFSGHLGMEWTGRKYNPFKKKIITRRT